MAIEPEVATMCNHPEYNYKYSPWRETVLGKVAVWVRDVICGMCGVILRQEIK